jgi:TolA-binding protein
MERRLAGQFGMAAEPEELSVMRHLVIRRKAVWSGMACLLLACWTVRAEDEIVTQSRTYRGTVRSADAGGVVIVTGVAGGQSVITVPRTIIVKITMAVPPDIKRGIEAYEQGNFKDAQAQLEKSALKYQGLDLDWAANGMIYYARACLAGGEYDKAQKAFELFMAGYPDHAMMRDAQIGLVDIELAKKNYAVALDKFRQLAEYYDKQLKPPRNESLSAAAIYVGIGKCLEGQSQPAEAVKAYLQVVALYPVEPYCSEALFRSAMIYAGLDQPEQADIRLRELIGFYPASVWATKAIEEQKKIAARLETNK